LDVVTYTDVKTGEEKEECNVMTWKKTKYSRHETLHKTGIITAGSQFCHQTKQHLSYTQDYKQSISISRAAVSFLYHMQAVEKGGWGHSRSPHVNSTEYAM
jgi:hypothetical protein